ncbi:MAG: Mg2+/Co2+ transporter CorB [Candidatus Endobugula sp.]
MDDIPLSMLFSFLGILIVLSGFFSSSETSMMSLNRYRLRHLEKKEHKGAIRAAALLRRPERLIGMILIGNNLVNNFAAALTTLIALRLYGEEAVWSASVLLTLAVLIFAEVTPKTIAALYPEKVAFPFTLILKPLLLILYPAVWLVNHMSNALAQIFGINTTPSPMTQHLHPDELRTVVDEAGDLIPDQHQDMLLNILDLEKASVEDIMIPRSEIVGINLEDSPKKLLTQLKHLDYTRIPVYEGDINNVVGIFHLRYTTRFLLDENNDISHNIKRLMLKPYFVPESTPLHTQLLNFQKQKHSLALVVDEYGDIQGLVTIEDLLEEIVGEFTTNAAETHQPDIRMLDSGWNIIEGSASIREINKSLDWSLPTNGPKTLNGLMMEYLETIPKGHISFMLSGYRFETQGIASTMIESARVKRILTEEAQ